ncbi:ribonuclease H-like domain-containing protein [Candidatus Parcubacteria bacterium]|nr:ribonuclease H-like domain-containing protein [Candidatus Parcubacteria bacterium]
MVRLIFDIETVGEEFNNLDPMTQEALTRWIRREADDETEYERLLQDLKDGLGFSPLTGQIVAIGAYDPDRGKGAVYFDAAGQTIEPFEQGMFSCKPMTEAEMLAAFWKGAVEYREFISFAGRSFDAPFLAIRSAIHKIRPTVDLMSNRYLSSQRGAVHIDLQDQFTFYGAVRRKGSLHLWCRAFGIKSPKAEGVTGDDVGRLFREGKVREIARYNAGDLVATKELFEYWNNYLRF